MKRTLLLVLSIAILSGFTFASSSNRENGAFQQTTKPLFISRAKEYLAIKCLLGSNYVMEFSPSKAIDIPRGNRAPIITIQMGNGPVLVHPVTISNDGSSQKSTIRLTYDEFFDALISENITIRFDHLGFERTVVFTNKYSYTEDFLKTELKICPNSFSDWEGTYLTDQLAYLIIAALLAICLIYIGSRYLSRGYPQLTREELVEQYREAVTREEAIIIYRTIMVIILGVVFAICSALIERPSNLLLFVYIAALIIEGIISGVVEVKTGIYVSGFKRTSQKFYIDVDHKFIKRSYWKIGIFTVLAFFYFPWVILFFL